MPADADNASVLAPRPPRPGKKYFSVVEANRALPYIRRIVADMRGPYEEMVRLEHEVEGLPPGTQRERLEPQLDRLRDQVSALLEELRVVGVELKDLDKMLLDFPAIHDGREIYLCWRGGEPAVQAWHEIGAGFTGRQDITLLDKAK